MTTSIRFMSYLTLTIGLSVTGQSMAQISDCSGQWQVFSQIPDNEGAFPDTHVSYFRYTFQLPAERKIMFKVSGRYPRGRYMGFNIYNSVQMDSKTGIADFEIEPDSGSENPYRTGDADTAGSYTLWMNPHEPKIAQTPMVNDLTAATDDPTAKLNREIWYRIYAPSNGAGGSGEVDLPRVEAYDQSSGRPVACPTHVEIPVPKGSLDWSKLWTLPPGPREDKSLHFVHHQGMGLYANRDTHYVAARLPLRGSSDDVAIIKFRAPRVPSSMGDLGHPERADVRYWSFCIGSAMVTTTSSCLSDGDAIVDENGFVTIVIGKPAFRVLTSGVNFMNRPNAFLPMLIYRNLLTTDGFTGDIRTIPFWMARNPLTSIADDFAADKFIGDYAPVGLVCPSAEYQTTRCQH